MKEIIFQQLSNRLTRSVNVHPARSRDMSLWKLWPTIQTEERISVSYEQKAPSKLTEAQKEMDKKTKGL
jgi:hypothetical protein